MTITTLEKKLRTTTEGRSVTLRPAMSAPQPQS
jgi:hypothetical protein